MSEPSFGGNIETAKGVFFQILGTTKRSQIATMTVPAGDEAGPAETHQDADQVFLFLEGKALTRVWNDGPDGEPEESTWGPMDSLVVPAGIKHWVKSVGDAPLFFFSVYAPPEY